MTKLMSTFLAAATLLATAAAPALADGDNSDARIAKRVDATFARLDTDKDGKLSRAEAAKSKRLADNFDKVDTDHDGFVSRAELSAAMQHMAHAKG